MLTWILQISIISIIFIFLIHNLLSFLKSTLTIPKIKDLVNSPIIKYQHIFDTISNSNKSQTYNSNDYNNDLSNSYTDIDLLPTENTNTNTNTNINTNTDMKDELKMFLKKQLNPSVNNTEPEALGSGAFASFQ
jgi:hypothetical protein